MSGQGGGTIGWGGPGTSCAPHEAANSRVLRQAGRESKIKGSSSGAGGLPTPAQVAPGGGESPRFGTFSFLLKERSGRWQGSLRSPGKERSALP